MAPEVPIIDCNETSIKIRAKEWINQLKDKNSDKTILVSAMADATKVPSLGEFHKGITHELVVLTQSILLLTKILIRINL